MCGICGTAGFAQSESLDRMVSLMVHRGPDDRGVFVSPESMFGLGNCRLSIIDLSEAGHMPMSNEDGKIWLSYNGEIYNFPSLRAELETRGHHFRSRTDSEVLIHGYEEWGPELLSRLNGMFALALVDLRHGPGELLLARDRFGVKPLYYAELGGRLIFASEVKAMFAVAEVPRSIDLASLHRYLAFLWVPGPETMFQQINKLAPGHYLHWRDGGYAIRSYWNMRFDPTQVADEREASLQLREILGRVVQRQSISDVPLGIFLSGGVDSSAIVALAAQSSTEPVSTYTIAYRPEDGILEQSNEDASAARLVANRFGTRHHEIVVEPRISDLLPKVIWHLDEPVADPAAISTYLICKAARSQLKVLLSGQGGDEVFAGYRVYGLDRLSRLLRHIPPHLRNGNASSALNLLARFKDRVPGVSPGLILGVHRYLSKLLGGIDLAPEDRFVFNRSYYTDVQLRSLYTPELANLLANSTSGDRHKHYFEDVTGTDFVNQMLYVDLKTFLPELNLTYSDKLSSAASVEVRVPFLDNEIFDFMSRVPANLKLNGLRAKYLLRKALDHTLPREILRRRKAGFGAPIRAWLRRDLRDMVDDILSERSIKQRGFFDAKAVRNLITNDREGREDNALRIWALLTLELWQRTFVDGTI